VTAIGSFSAEGMVRTLVAWIAIVYSPHLYSRGVFCSELERVCCLTPRRSARRDNDGG
jgi:hypothetical protein